MDMENCYIAPIDESYNRQMLSILANSPIVANGLSLCFDKAPDIFAIPRLKYSTSEHAGFFQQESLKGFASLGYYDAFVGGQEERVFTFYNFFLLPELRGDRIAGMAMKEFFSRAREKANYGISVTLKGNRPAESYIGRQVHDWMPPTRIIDELVVKSIFLSYSKQNKTEYPVRNARLEDIPDIIKLLNEEHRQRDFGLIFQEEGFLSALDKRGLEITDYYVATNRKGAIKGVCLAWDCFPFRRTRVLKFSANFYPLLFAYKVLEKFLPMAPFPEKGESFHELTITDYAVADRNIVILHALLSEIYYRNLNRKYHFMNFASCRSDKLLKAATGFWHKDIVSHIIFTSLDAARYTLQTRLPYIDIAFL